MELTGYWVRLPIHIHPVLEMQLLSTRHGDIKIQAWMPPENPNDKAIKQHMATGCHQLDPGHLRHRRSLSANHIIIYHQYPSIPINYDYRISREHLRCLWHWFPWLSWSICGCNPRRPSKRREPTPGAPRRAARSFASVPCRSWMPSWMSWWKPSQGERWLEDVENLKNYKHVARLQYLKSLTRKLNP